MILNGAKSSNPAEFEAMLRQADANEAIKSIFILACDENGFTPETIDGVLRQVQKPIFGGIFPEIIFHREKWTQGFIVAGLPDVIQVQSVPGLNDMSQNYDTLIEAIDPPPATQTILTLVDGLSARISALLDSLFNVFGLEYNYIGGGAGSLSFQQKPCLFTNDGLVQDCALLAMLPNRSGVGVSHGWTDVAGPFQVTESDRNIVRTLDWKPAFDVYKAVIQQHSGRAFDGTNFFDIAKCYPFGIQKLDAEKIVRDPIQVDDHGAIVCVGEVPQESYVHILTGNSDSLIQAAGCALQRSEQSYTGHPDNKTVLFVDCISRVLFLENDFSKELDAVYRQNRPLIGALTLGEIANNGKDFLEFYNKTSVVATLED